MGFRIVNKISLNSVVSRIAIEAPAVAKRTKPGQFVVIRVDEKGERIPLTVASKDVTKGVITIIVQALGKTTKKLSSLKKGDQILDLIGPLGKPTDFGKIGKTVFVGGGVGIAEILPVLGYAKAQGNHIVSILGARTKELLILVEEIKLLSDEVILVTDDGSFGEKGNVLGPLERTLQAVKPDLCYAVGPDIMMRAVSDLTRKDKIRTIVSLDANMIDATGMCGTCRVKVGDKILFTCVDGPEFDGHLIHWDAFLKRQKRFSKEERLADELYTKEHPCQRQNAKNRTQNKG
ncbi:MAG: sulfide/dihydroorotate dehydrogenase-like FAD/NAD-binding protein [Candidatus Omnitrophota bacterium]